MPTIRKCLTCGKEFKTFLSTIKVGKGNYCSRKCVIFPKGVKHFAWKGNNAGYSCMHKWIATQLGNPKKCEDCGIENPEKMYHWANISKKYKRDISDWKRLCVKCHKSFDKTSAKGEKNGNSKLTEEDILQIRHLYTLSQCLVPLLAKQFNIHKSSVYRIIKRVGWKHI